MCVRLYRRADGMVMTEDCPVGARHKRRVRLAVATVGGSLLAAAAAMGAREQQTCTMGAAAVVEPPVVQGEITMGDFAPPPPSLQPSATPPHQVTMGKPTLPAVPAPPKTSELR
jgi:hypothetical protein